jgi:hypothetical protein
MRVSQATVFCSPCPATCCSLVPLFSVPETREANGSDPGCQWPLATVAIR